MTDTFNIDRNVDIAYNKHKEDCWLCENYALEEGDRLYMHSSWDGGIGFDYIEPIRYCPICGRDLREEDE